mgnify:CR=1 FL=1
MKPSELAPGFYPDYPAEDYHTRELGMASKSCLDVLQSSPSHVKAWAEDTTTTEEQSRALFIGAAFHCATLEPARFERIYAVKPDFGDGRYKEAKDKTAAWRLANEGRIVLSEADDKAIRGMARSIHDHPLAAPLLEGGTPEVTLRWRDEESGVECKVRADYWNEAAAICTELKTTADARSEMFSKSVYSYRYHVQQALYSEGFRALGKPLRYFIFVCVEKEPPFAVAVYQLDVVAVARGDEIVRDGLDVMGQCVASGIWPGYPQKIQKLSLPPWA